VKAGELRPETPGHGPNIRHALCGTFPLRSSSDSRPGSLAADSRFVIVRSHAADDSSRDGASQSWDLENSAR